MSMHAEWDSARTCHVGAGSRDEINTEAALPDMVTEPYAVVLGGDGGGCLVIEGTADDLIRFADRVGAAVRVAVKNRP